MGHMNNKITNGLSGGAYVGGTDATTGDWCALQVLTDAKFHTLTGNLSGVANTTSGSAPTIPAGSILFGKFTALKLHSGSLVAYIN